MSEPLFILVHLAAVVVLLFFSACSSAAETALFFLSRTQVRLLSQMPGRAERAITALLEDPSRLLTTILLVNMLANLLFASVVALLVRRYNGDSHVLLAIAVSTVLVLVVGEVTPKTLATRHPLLLARWLAGPVYGLSRLLTPARWAMRQVLAAVMAVLGQRHVPSWGMLTREEIRALLAAGEAEGVTSAKGREVAENILELPLVRARDIMVPRTEVKGLPDSLTLAEAYALVCSHRHSRLPVYHSDLDDIWGYLTVLDLPRFRNQPILQKRVAEFRPRPGLAPAAAAGGTDVPVHPVLICPENAPIEKVLAQMRAPGTDPLAVLVDEYGGTSGILTFQDILAEIMGQLAPLRTADHSVYVRAGNSVLVEGQAALRDLNRKLDLGLHAQSADSIGGFVMEQLGRLPRAGDAVTYRDRLRLHVIKMAGRRVGAVRIERLDGRSWTAEGGE